MSEAAIEHFTPDEIEELHQYRETLTELPALYADEFGSSADADLEIRTLAAARRALGEALFREFGEESSVEIGFLQRCLAFFGSSDRSGVLVQRVRDALHQPPLSNRHREQQHLPWSRAHRPSLSVPEPRLDG